jgi:hypothetical protein
VNFFWRIKKRRQHGVLGCRFSKGLSFVKLGSRHFLNDRSNAKLEDASRRKEEMVRAGYQSRSLDAVSGAIQAAVAVIDAQAMRNIDTGQVGPPLHATRDAAIKGLNPPLSAARPESPAKHPCNASGQETVRNTMPLQH